MTPFDSFDGMNKWIGRGNNFDFLVRQYQSAYVVDIQFIQIKYNGVRLLKEKKVGSFETAEQAQEYAEQYDDE